MSSNFTNGTYHSALESLALDQGKLLVLSFISFVAIITFVYNCLIVAAFVNDRRIRTPFNYYILNLTLADLSLALLAMPILIRDQLTSTWPYGRSLCTVVEFCSWTCSGAGAHAVMWISLDRMWSLYKPVHYRNHSSNHLTIAVCMGIWIYLTALIIPYSYLDQTVYLAPGEVCRPNVAAQPQYTLFLEVVLYILPLIVVTVVYAAIIVKLWKRKFKVRSLKVPSGATLRKAQSRIQEKTDATAVQRIINSNQVNPMGSDSREEGRRMVSEEEKSERKLFGALAWIGICMIALWSPAAIFYIIASYVDWVYSDTAVGVVICLEYASCVINPFIYHRSLPDIHRAVNALFGR